MGTKLGIVVTLIVALIAFIPGSALGHAIGPQSARPDVVVSGDAVYNYTTSDSTDIKEVAISPDGSWVAAAGSHDHLVYVFSANGGSGGSITPTTTISLPLDANTMALSESGPGGSPLLVVGWGGNLSVYNVTSSTPYWTYSNFTTTGSATLQSVAISQDGTDIAAVATVPEHQGSAPYFVYVYLQDGTRINLYDSQDYAIPSGVSMDVDGSRLVVGQTISAAASILIFQPKGGPQSWTPTAPFGASYNLANAAISGDGNVMFETSSSGFSVTPEATPTLTTVVSPLQSATFVSASYDGCVALVTQGSTAYYYNATPQTTQQGLANCAYADKGFSTPIWSATFPNAVAAISLATSNSGYFVVAWGNTVDWYYGYVGMPTNEIPYRTMQTIGTIASITLSGNGAVAGVGSAFLVGGGDEFALALDMGVPVPAPLNFQLIPVSSSPGDTSASVTIQWSGVPQVGFTSVQINFITNTPGASMPVNPAPVTSASTTKVTVGGLSFSSNYSVSLTLVTFGGASGVSTQYQSFTTASTPPVLDPFVPFEVASVILIIAAVVMYLLVRRSLPKHEAPPSQPQAYIPAQRPVQRAPPPAGGGP
jgi:WD40 repeat protein